MSTIFSSVKAFFQQLEDYILEQVFGNGKERGHKAEKDLIKQEIRKFTNIDILALYKLLFNNEDCFYSLLPNTRKASAKSVNLQKKIWKQMIYTLMMR